MKFTQMYFIDNEECIFKSLRERFKVTLVPEDSVVITQAINAYEMIMPDVGPCRCSVVNHSLSNNKKNCEHCSQLIQVAEHAKHCNKNSKARVNRHNLIVLDLLWVIHKYQVKETRRNEKVNADENFTDIRAQWLEGLVAVDVSIVRMNSFKILFNKKVKKHSTSGADPINGPKVVVLPVVADNIGTINSESIVMLKHDFPRLKIA